MNFKLKFTSNAVEHLEKLKSDHSKKINLKAVLKTLAYMETNLRHPSLQTHEYHSLKGPSNEKVYESCVQQNTPYSPSSCIVTVCPSIDVIDGKTYVLKKENGVYSIDGQGCYPLPPSH